MAAGDKQPNSSLLPYCLAALLPSQTCEADGAPPDAIGFYITSPYPLLVIPNLVASQANAIAGRGKEPNFSDPNNIMILNEFSRDRAARSHLLATYSEML